jgi:hypothetical protein
LCRQKGFRLRIFSECFDGWKIKRGKEEEEEEEEKAFSTGSNGRSQPFASVPVCVRCVGPSISNNGRQQQQQHPAWLHTAHTL